MTPTQSRAVASLPRRLTLALPMAGLILMIPKLAFAHVGLHDGMALAQGLATRLAALITCWPWSRLAFGRR